MAGLSVSNTGSDGGTVVGVEVGTATSVEEGEGEAVSGGSPLSRRQELNIIRVSIINIDGINPRLNIVFNLLSFLSLRGNAYSSVGLVRKICNEKAFLNRFNVLDYSTKNRLLQHIIQACRVPFRSI